MLPKEHSLVTQWFSLLEQRAIHPQLLYPETKVKPRLEYL